MFSFIKQKLQKIYTAVTAKAHALFSRTTLDEQTLKELEILLISADTGVETTRAIIEKLKKDAPAHKGKELRAQLAPILLSILNKPIGAAPTDTNIFLLVGINGSGKTTFAGKLAHYYAQQNKRVLLVAADTFRAAAPEQLAAWAQRCNADIVLGKPQQDPASVVFAGCQQFVQNNYDVLIIDTAGRLQTKVNLMNELSKIKKVITKQLPDNSIKTILTIDTMLGQNSFEQAQLFKKSTNVNSIVLTKMDGTGKGGILFAISDQLSIPIEYITFGEQPDQLKLFDAQEYVHGLLYPEGIK